MIESWFDYQISIILSIWNVCYKAQVSSCSIAFLRPETIIFPCSEMFCEKLIWLSNIRNFDILKWLLYDNFRNVRSFANFLISKCLLENWYDHKISELFTFWNVCYMTQLSKCSIVFLLLETLIFHSATMFDRKLIWLSNFRNFVNLKCLL